MQLFRCPNCQHWRCSNCDDRERWQLRCCQCGQVASAGQWYRGHSKRRARNLGVSPRLGTGRPLDASKPIVDKLIQFLERHAIPLNAFGRHTGISPWAIRQARAGKRSLPPIQEKLIDLTIQRIQAGKLWLRRVNPQRWDFESVNPPYKLICPPSALYCAGGILPATLPKTVARMYSERPELAGNRKNAANAKY